MRWIRLAYDNWFSRAYLLGVLAVTGWVLATVAADRSGPDFAGVWLIGATMPGSLVGVLAGVALGVGHANTVVVQAAVGLGVVAGAVADAMIIGLVVRQLRRRYSQ